MNHKTREDYLSLHWSCYFQPVVQNHLLQNLWPLNHLQPTEVPQLASMDLIDTVLRTDNSGSIAYNAPETVKMGETIKIQLLSVQPKPRRTAAANCRIGTGCFCHNRSTP